MLIPLLCIAIILFLGLKAVGDVPKRTDLWTLDEIKEMQRRWK